MKPVLVLLVSVWALDVFCANIPEPCPYSEYQDWYKLGSLCVKYYSTPLKFTDAEFVWTDESPWNYANWDTNEPNNQGNNEDCVEMNWTKSEKWNDLPCTENKTFICAFDITFCE